MSSVVLEACMFSLSKYALKAKVISSAVCWSVVSAVMFAGCAYRFSNQNLQTPEGIKSIAVEAVFDTSREVLHHEHLWTEIQKALASDGHLRLVPVAKADALVRAHIKSANFVPSGDTLFNGPEDDPNALDRETPEAPAEFKVLTQAGKYRDKAVISTVIEVEVWNLWTRTLILKRTYGVQDSLQTIHASITPKGNDFLRLEEAADAKFHQLTKNVAQQLVRDLFIY